MPRRKTQEEFEAEVLEKIGPDYKVLGQYINKNTKIEVIHYACGNTFLKRPHDITSKNSGCPFCNGNKKALYTEKWVKDNTPKDYEYLEGYTGMKTKCKFHCNICDTDFEQYPSRLILQHIYGCKCGGTKKKTHEEFLEELGEDTLKEYSILEEYVNIDTKIKIKHNKCNTEFNISPWSFIHKHNKQYCPICYYKKSHGEVAISIFLNQNNIEYQKEFIFPDFPNRRYDFYIPSMNIAIEFDGIQHTKPIDFFGGEEEFKKTRLRDIEKNKYCIDNNITLFRLTYKEIDNINQILHEIIKEKSSTTIEKFRVTE